MTSKKFDHNTDVQLVFSWVPKLARVNIGLPVVGTDGRSLGRCTVTRLPNFPGCVDLLSYGATLTRIAKRSAWSSAIKEWNPALWTTSLKQTPTYKSFYRLIQCLTLVLKPFNTVSASLNKFHFPGVFVEVTFSSLSALVFTSIQDLSVTFHR